MADELKDTPTHRLHLLQMSMQEISSFVEQLRVRRATISEKIAKAKSNSKVAQSLLTEKQFKKLVDRMERKLAAINIDLDEVSDNLNKARALFLQMSDGEVLLEKEVLSNGNEKVERN